jgi:hypothetical protein
MIKTIRPRFNKSEVRLILHVYKEFFRFYPELSKPAKEYFMKIPNKLKKLI